MTETAKVANGFVGPGDLITFASQGGHVTVASVKDVILDYEGQEDAGPDGHGGRKHAMRRHYKLKVEVQQTSALDLSVYSPRFRPPAKRRTLRDLHKVLKLSPTALSNPSSQDQLLRVPNHTSPA